VKLNSDTLFYLVSNFLRPLLSLSLSLFLSLFLSLSFFLSLGDSSQSRERENGSMEEARWWKAEILHFRKCENDTKLAAFSAAVLPQSHIRRTHNKLASAAFLFTGAAASRIKSIAFCISFSQVRDSIIILCLYTVYK
jgi:hypothetical protein